MGNPGHSQFIKRYLDETIEIAKTIDQAMIARAAGILSDLRERGGRLFILGVGGSAGNASHAVNDFRKIAGIEAYAPTDNVSELTAWTNDKSWESVFDEYLRVSKLSKNDVVLVYSVGGGSATTSKNLVLAMSRAKSVGAKIVAIVSRDGGKAKELADAAILVPVVDQSRVTPHAEGWQGVLWHMLVNCILGG